MKIRLAVQCFLNICLSISAHSKGRNKALQSEFLLFFSFTAKIDQLQNAGTQPANTQGSASTADDASKKEAESSDESEEENAEVC